MGGKKKLTLRQMQRIQGRRDRERRERRLAGSATEKRGIGLVPPDLKSGKVISELKKIRALTPYTVATRFDIRLSVARDFLKELERRGIVEYVSGSKNLKIYKPLD